MRPGIAIEAKIPFHNSSKMLFGKYNHVVKTFAAYTADHSFRVWILPRTPGGCNDFLDLHASYPPTELFTEYLISISQEEARRGFIRKRFDDLLRGPGGGRMLGNIEMHHTSAMMSEYDQDE